MSETLVTTAGQNAYKARAAANEIARFSAEMRERVLYAVADQLDAASDEIVRANTQDLEIADVLLEKGDITLSMYQRLKLDAVKLRGLTTGIRQLAQLPDPLQAPGMVRELDDNLILRRVPCPIGLVLVIFESRPDALPQIISLLLKSGNAGLIKGGKEAQHSIKVLFEAIMRGLKQLDYPADSFALLSGREEATAMLQLEGVIDLIIPRGSNELVRQIQNSTKIPVLGHADGICHVYIHKNADLVKAKRIAVDSKCQYPAACNSTETILIDQQIAHEFLPDLLKTLSESSVELRCTESDITTYGLSGVNRATEKDWSTEYCDLILSVKVVQDIDEAIRHINKYGSRHTDAIVTQDTDAFEKFAAEVDSAGVFLNASTRFADGFRYGFGAEVGISTSKLHPRGPVGIEGLITYKYLLQGDGHIVEDYSGASARQFKHKTITN